MPVTNIVDAATINMVSQGRDIQAPGSVAYTNQLSPQAKLESLAVANVSTSPHYINVFADGSGTLRWLFYNLLIPANQTAWLITKENESYYNNGSSSGRFGLEYNTMNGGYSGGSAGDLHMIWSYQDYQT